MYSKANQLKKHRKSNGKRLPKVKLHEFRQWLGYTYPLCQICNQREAEEAHHAKYGSMGADKDDRTLVAVCRTCHHQIHHGAGYPVHGKSRDDIEKIGEGNWDEYNL